MFIALLLFLSVVLGVLKLGGVLAFSWWLVALPGLIAGAWIGFLLFLVLLAALAKP